MYPNIKQHIVLPSIPPILPSIVFLGLTSGINLCLPNKYPAKYAKVSVINAIINISQTNFLPSTKPSIVSTIKSIRTPT